MLNPKQHHVKKLISDKSKLNYLHNNLQHRSTFLVSTKYLSLLCVVLFAPSKDLKWFSWHFFFASNTLDWSLLLAALLCSHLIYGISEIWQSLKNITTSVYHWRQKAISPLSWLRNNVSWSCVVCKMWFNYLLHLRQLQSFINVATVRHYILLVDSL